MLQQAEVRFHVMNGILAESDVQQLPFAHIRLVLGKEKCQFRQLQAQRQMGTDRLFVCTL